MSEYVPVVDLPHIEDYDWEHQVKKDAPPLFWEFTLPDSIDAERLQVNLSAVRRYQRVGAMAMGVVTGYQGETTEFTPGISGIGPGGTAVASKVGTIKSGDKSRSRHAYPSYIPPWLQKTFGLPIMIHDLNRAEIAQNIGEGVRSGKTREQVWAEQLDDALRDSFRRGGKEHLMGLHRPLRYMDYASFSLWGGSVAYESMHTIPIIAPAIWIAAQIGFTGLHTQSLKRQTGDGHLDEKRWSIFYANHQSDRYVASNGLSRVSRLISLRK